MSASRPLSSEPDAPSLHSRIRSPSVSCDGEQVGVDLVHPVERLEDQVAVGMGAGVDLGDPALVDQALDEGVVAGELADLLGAEQVGAAVADVSHRQARPVEQRHRRGGAGAAERRLLVDEVADPVGSTVQGCVDEPEPRLLVVGLAGRLVEEAQLADGGARREVTAGRAPDAVADREQPGSGVAGVLVVLAYAPDVRDRGVLQSERHFRSSRMVLPIRTWVPRASVVGWVIRALPM